MLGDTGALRNKPKGVRPKHLLSKVDVLARSVLPSLSKEDRGRILRVRAGFERAARNRPPLLLHGKNLGRCAGALNRGDLKDARKYQREELGGAKLVHLRSIEQADLAEIGMLPLQQRVGPAAP